MKRSSVVRSLSRTAVILALSGGTVLGAASTAQALTPPAPVPVGSYPFGVTLNPAATTAYAPNLGDGTVSVISLATGQVTTIPGFTSPSAVTVSPDGSVGYVAQEAGQGPSSIATVDLITDTVSGAIPVNGGVADVALSPDGSTLYAALLNSNEVAIIHLTGSAPAVSYLPVPTPTALRVDSNDTVYVTSSSTKSLTMINGNVPSQSQPLVANQNGLVLGEGFVYVTAGLIGGAGTVTQLDLSGNVIRTVLVGEQPGRPGLTPDGKTLYVPALTGNNITEIDTQTGTVIATITNGVANPTAVTVTPDGQLGLIANAGSDSVSFFTPRTSVQDAPDPSDSPTPAPSETTPAVIAAPATTTPAATNTDLLAETGSDPVPIALTALIAVIGGTTLIIKWGISSQAKHRRR